MTYNSTAVDAAAAHLQQVSENPESFPVDWNIIEPAAKILGSLPSPAVLPLVGPMVAILQGTSETNRDMLLPLLVEVVDKVEVPSGIASVGDDALISGLNSHETVLTCAVIRLISRSGAYPVNPEIIDCLLKLLLKEDCKFQSASALVALLTAQRDVRSYVFENEKHHAILSQIKREQPSFLMELVEPVVSVSDTVVDNEWLLFDLDTADVLMVVNCVEFYTRLVSNPHKPEIVNAISEKLSEIFRLFDTTDDLLVKSSCYPFFAALSSHEPTVFLYFDKQYSLILKNENDARLFASVDAAYLATYEDLVKALALKSSTASVFAHLISCKDSYSLLQLSSQKILALSVEPKLFIINCLTCTPWGSSDLLTKWPQVMDYLMSIQVYEPNLRSLAIHIMENLLLRFTDITNASVWRVKIRQKWQQLTGAVDNTPQALVAS